MAAIRLLVVLCTIVSAVASSSDDTYTDSDISIMSDDDEQPIYNKPKAKARKTVSREIYDKPSDILVGEYFQLKAIYEELFDIVSALSNCSMQFEGTEKLCPPSTRISIKDLNGLSGALLSRENEMIANQLVSILNIPSSSRASNNSGIFKYSSSDIQLFKDKLKSLKVKCSLAGIEVSSSSSDSHNVTEKHSAATTRKGKRQRGKKRKRSSKKDIRRKKRKLDVESVENVDDDNSDEREENEAKNSSSAEDNEEIAPKKIIKSKFFSPKEEPFRFVIFLCQTFTSNVYDKESDPSEYIFEAIKAIASTVCEEAPNFESNAPIHSQFPISSIRIRSLANAEKPELFIPKYYTKQTYLYFLAFFTSKLSICDMDQLSHLTFWIYSLISYASEHFASKLKTLKYHPEQKRLTCDKLEVSWSETVRVKRLAVQESYFTLFFVYRAISGKVACGSVHFYSNILEEIMGDLKARCAKLLKDDSKYPMGELTRIRLQQLIRYEMFKSHKRTQLADELRSIGEIFSPGDNRNPIHFFTRIIYNIAMRKPKTMFCQNLVQYDQKKDEFSEVGNHATHKMCEYIENSKLLTRGKFFGGALKTLNSFFSALLDDDPNVRTLNMLFDCTKRLAVKVVSSEQFPRQSEVHKTFKIHKNKLQYLADAVRPSEWFQPYYRYRQAPYVLTSFFSMDLRTESLAMLHNLLFWIFSMAAYDPSQFPRLDQIKYTSDPPALTLPNGSKILYTQPQDPFHRILDQSIHITSLVYRTVTGMPLFGSHHINLKKLETVFELMNEKASRFLDSNQPIPDPQEAYPLSINLLKKIAETKLRNCGTPHNLMKTLFNKLNLATEADEQFSTFNELFWSVCLLLPDEILYKKLIEYDPSTHEFNEVTD